MGTKGREGSFEKKKRETQEGRERERPFFYKKEPHTHTHTHKKKNKKKTWRRKRIVNPLQMGLKLALVMHNQWVIARWERLLSLSFFFFFNTSSNVFLWVMGICGRRRRRRTRREEDRCNTLHRFWEGKYRTMVDHDAQVQHHIGEQIEFFFFYYFWHTTTTQPHPHNNRI